MVDARRVILTGWATVGIGAIGAGCTKGIVGKVLWVVVSVIGALLSDVGSLEIQKHLVMEDAEELPDPRVKDTVE